MATTVTVEQLLISASSKYTSSEFSIRHLKLPFRLNDQIQNIAKKIKLEILDPIYDSRDEEVIGIQFEGRITQFQNLCFKVIEIIRKQYAQSDLLELDLRLFDDINSMAKDSKWIEPETRSRLLDVIGLLREYDIKIYNLIKERKESLQEAITRVDIDDFLRSLYGAYLGIVCASLSLEPRLNTQFYRKRDTLSTIFKKAIELADRVNLYLRNLERLTANIHVDRLSIFPSGSPKNKKFPIPEHVNFYIDEQQLGDNAASQLSRFLNEVDNYLNDIKHDIVVDVFVDIDDPDLTGIKIILSIEKDLKTIYEEVKPKVYALKRELPRKVAEKILIQFN